MLPQQMVAPTCYGGAMNRRFVCPVLMLALVISAAGCGDGDSDDLGELGSPCVEDRDCKAELICDMHDGRGSCQKPHDH